MQVRSLETRAIIQKSALKLFGEHGYDATGVAEICSDAGVSKGAFYHHFTTKQDVFLELMEEWLQGLEANLRRTLEDSPSVPEALIRMAAQTKEVFQAADGSMPFFLEFWAKASRDPVVWNRTIDPYRRFQEMFSDIVRKGVEEGVFRPVDPRLIAQILLSFAIGLVMQSVFVPQGERWDQVAEDAVRLFVEALRRKKE